MDTWSGAAHLAVAAAISAPLMYAGTSKILDPWRFARTIGKYGIDRLPATADSARAVAIVELLASLTSLLWAMPATSLLSASMYAGLAILMVRAILRGSTGDCGCFGALGGRIDATAVARNFALMLASVGLAWARATNIVATYEPPTALVATVAVTLGAAAAETFFEIRRAAAERGN